MSRGKYSLSHIPSFPEGYIYNCYGQIPEEYHVGMKYDENKHFVNYDREGYDSYGYSCFNWDGSYAGHGQGVDRAGWTEFDYLQKMT